MDSKNISVSVYENNRGKIHKADNSSQEYIILQNEALNNKNRDYILQLEEKCTIIDELEQDNGKMETQIQNMRGILHNFSFKIKKLEEMVDIKDAKYKDLKAYTKLTDHFIKFLLDSPKIYITVILVILSAFYILNIISLWDSMVFLCLNTITLFIIGYHYKDECKFLDNVNNNTSKMNEKLNAYNNSMRQIQYEINEIDKANNFIEEYIDII